MKKEVEERSTPIQTMLVYSKDEVVFTKDDQENWLPVHFNWVPIQTV